MIGIIRFHPQRAYGKDRINTGWQGFHALQCYQLSPERQPKASSNSANIIGQFRHHSSHQLRGKQVEQETFLSFIIDLCVFCTQFPQHTNDQIPEARKRHNILLRRILQKYTMSFPDTNIYSSESFSFLKKYEKIEFLYM